MGKVAEVLTSTRLWTAVVATGAVFYTLWTGNEVTPEQLAKTQTTVLAIVSIAAMVIGADTVRKLGTPTEPKQ
jgi:hypothetical protein